MSKLNNVVIVGKKDYIIAVSFENFNDKSPECLYYSNENNLPIKDEDDKSATALNSLYVICDYLEEIQKIKATRKQVSYIVVPNIIYDKISKGTYKNWVLTGGYLNSDKQINKLELALWTRFLQLYNDLFSIVEFKPLSLYNMKSPKFNASHVKYVNNFIKQCWALIEQHENEKLGAILTASAAQ